MAGRGRLSSLDLMPDEAQDDIVRACQQLARRDRTQSDILSELNGHLADKGLELISKSAFNRRAIRLAVAQRRMQDARAMFDGIASQFTAKDVDESTVVLGEFIKTLIIELVDDQAGDKTPKQAMELASAYRSVVSGQKISSERRRKLELELKESTEKVIEKVTAEAGLSAERAAQIRRDVLGVRSKPAEG